MATVDLHMHTYYSDGRLSPGDVVKINAYAGVEYLAVTDHDTTASSQSIIESGIPERYGVQVIPGVEISTQPYHILGLNVNLYDSAFQQFLSGVREIQLQNVAERVELLQSHNIPITYEKVLSCNYWTPDKRLGKVNVAMALILDPECREVLRKESLFGLGMVLEKYLLRGGIAYDIEKRDVAPEKAIRAIHDAGGLSIIAHPFKEVKDLKELDVLVEMGLDGIEIQPWYGQRNDPFHDYAIGHGLIITYGSDFHSPEQIKRPLLGRNNPLVPSRYMNDMPDEVLAMFLPKPQAYAKVV